MRFKAGLKGLGRREGKKFASGDEYQEGRRLHLQAYRIGDVGEGGGIYCVISLQRKQGPHGTFRL